jgi:hypothetical protein
VHRMKSGALAWTGVVWTLAGFVLAFGCYVLLVLWPVSIHPTSESTWIKRIYDIKRAAAREGRQRVIIVGGSNVHFGLQARVLSGATGRLTINFGTHAGLGLRYILANALPYIAAEDVVVLALEYDLYASRREIDPTLASYIRAYDRDYVARLPATEMISVAASVSAKELLQAYVNFKVAPAYDASLITKDGDETGNTLARRPNGKWTGATTDRGSRFFQGIPSSYSEAEINRFITRCRAKRATIIATWPSLVDLPSSHGAPAQTAQRAIREFYAQRGIPVIGTPDAALIAPNDVFDSPYHPLLSWSAAHSRALGRELASILTTRSNVISSR